MRTLTAVVLFLFSGVFAACGDAGVGLDIQFQDAGGLAPSDRVVYADIPVGEVTGTDKAPAGTVVHVSVRKEFAHLLTEHTRFYVIPDPDRKDRPAVELTRTRRGGAPLPEGARVEGSVRMSDAYRRTLEDAQKQLESLTRELKEFSDDVARLPESEEFRRLKRKTERLVEELRQSGREAKEKLETEVLPALRKQWEELKEKLRKRKQEEAPGPVSV